MYKLRNFYVKFEEEGLLLGKSTSFNGRRENTFNSSNAFVQLGQLKSISNVRFSKNRLLTFFLLGRFTSDRYVRCIQFYF